MSNTAPPIPPFRKGSYVFFDDFMRAFNSLQNQISNISGGGGTITATSFSTPTYQNAALIGKNPDVNFLVFADEGGGGLMKEGADSYSFDGATGTITPTYPGTYRVVYSTTP